jgi:hypothetical protein
VREVATGLWHWQAPHAQWRSTEPWGPEVSSYAIDDGERLLLFDPLAVPGDIEEIAANREGAIMLTNPWHERDSRDLVERLRLPDFGNGLEINPRWLSPDMTREQVVEGLRPLLDLPVEHMLATHGVPFERADLERALSL